MKIVITGGMGFIGSHLAKRLIKDGHEVLLVDSLTPQIHGDLPDSHLPDGAEFRRVDARRLADRPEILEGCEVVYHLAAETGTAQSMYNIVEYVDVNEMGTAALMTALAKCRTRPRKIVLASSRSVYGEGGYVSEKGSNVLFTPKPRSPMQLLNAQWEPTHDDFPEIFATATREDCDIVPSSIYAATKASQEHLIRIAADSLGIESVIFRLQNVYGEGQSLRNPYTGIISIFYNRARQGIEIPIYEDGLESRDFVHVEDVTRAFMDSATAELPSGVVMNIGSGKPTTVIDLAKMLLRTGNLDVPLVVTGQYRVGDIRHGWADIEKAHQLLGFAPQVTFEAGLARFTKWASEQPAHEDLLGKATKELQDRGLTK